MPEGVVATADETQVVMSNWAPRMIAQGVDSNDFARVTAGVQRWYDWLPAWEQLADEYASAANDAETVAHATSAGELWLRAAICYHFARFVWVVDPARNRSVLAKSVAAHRAAMRHIEPDMRRFEIPFDGGMMAGNLRTPRHGSGRHPLVVLLPGSDSTKEEFFHWENVFLSRGLATFSLDGPGQGETVVSLPMRADYEKAVSAALDIVLQEDDVDADRLAVVGVSLGGFYATRAAAFDDRFRAVVNVSGGYEVGEGLGKRGPLQLRVFQDYSWTTNSEEDARALGAKMNLRGIAERVTQPMLVVIGGSDRVRDPGQTLRTAEEAPNSTTHTFPEGNHVCFNVATRARPLIGDWVADQLRGTGTASQNEGGGQ